MRVAAAPPTASPNARAACLGRSILTPHSARARVSHDSAAVALARSPRSVSGATSGPRSVSTTEDAQISDNEVALAVGTGRTIAGAVGPAMDCVQLSG